MLISRTKSRRASPLGVEMRVQKASAEGRLEVADGMARRRYTGKVPARRQTATVGTQVRS
jgi:hypothetical protein